MTCLKAAGIKVIVAASFARIFFRNAVNNSVLPVVCPEAAAAIQPGETISVDIDRYVVRCAAGEFAFPAIVAVRASNHRGRRAAGDARAQRGSRHIAWCVFVFRIAHIVSPRNTHYAIRRPHANCLFDPRRWGGPRSDPGCGAGDAGRNARPAIRGCRCRLGLLSAHWNGAARRHG